MRRIFCLAITIFLICGGLSAAAVDFDFDDLFQDDLVTDVEPTGGVRRGRKKLY